MTDQLHQPIMTTPHRATPLQWRLVEEDDAQAPSCILELRSRIEALEATQHAPTTTEVRPGGLVERVAAAIDGAPFDEGLNQWDEARAAIREVAKWLRAGRMLHAAELLEQETDHD
jgi:hypothetical protein